MPLLMTFTDVHLRCCHNPQSSPHGNAVQTKNVNFALKWSRKKRTEKKKPVKGSAPSPVTVTYWSVTRWCSYQNEAWWVFFREHQRCRKSFNSSRKPNSGCEVVPSCILPQRSQKPWGSFWCEINVPLPAPPPFTSHTLRSDKAAAAVAACLRDNRSYQSCVKEKGFEKKHTNRSWFPQSLAQNTTQRSSIMTHRYYVRWEY